MSLEKHISPQEPLDTAYINFEQTLENQFGSEKRDALRATLLDYMERVATASALPDALVYNTEKTQAGLDAKPEGVSVKRDFSNTLSIEIQTALDIKKEDWPSELELTFNKFIDTVRATDPEDTVAWATHTVDRLTTPEAKAA